MRNLQLTITSIFVSFAVFAQSSTLSTLQLSNTPLPYETISETPPTAQQLIVGTWDLKTINGQSVDRSGQTVQGDMTFTAANTFKGILMGEAGDGFYNVLNSSSHSSGFVLEITEYGKTYEVVLIRLTSTELILFSDRDELFFSKR